MRYHLVAVMLLLAAACAPKATVVSPPPGAGSPLQAGWYVDPVKDDLLLTLLNRGDTALSLERLVVNEHDNEGFFYATAPPLAVPPGRVVVLRLDDFHRVRGSGSFACRLPASLDVTARRGDRTEHIVAAGLPALPSALPHAFKKCDGHVVD